MSEPGEFTYRRVHDAPRELLFDCLTQPEHLTHFWGPDGMTTPAAGITVDLRPGGSFETVMVNAADGSTYTIIQHQQVKYAQPFRLRHVARTVGDDTVRQFQQPIEVAICRHDQRTFQHDT